MDQNTETFRELNGKVRISGYDIARAMAIFLMLLINFSGFLSLDEAYPDWVSEVIGLLDRRAAATLVMISGIGLSLFTRNPIVGSYVKVRPGSRRSLIDRIIFLFFFGYAFSIIWAADILHFYAVFILIGTFLSSKSDRSLLVAALIFWMGSLVQFFNVYDILEDDLIHNRFTGEVIDLFFTGFYPVFPWAAFFILGMVLGRLDFQDRRLRKRMFTIGFLLLISSEFLSRLFSNLSEHMHSTGSDYVGCKTVLIHYFAWFMYIDLTVPTPFSVISGIGSGLIIVLSGVSLSSIQQKKWIEYLIVGGQNTLTLYITHIVFLILAGHMVTHLNSERGLIDVTAATLFFIVYIKGVTKWLKKHKNGPLESLMREFSVSKLLTRKC